MRAILIDDEPLALEYLEFQIKKISNLQIAGKFNYFNLQKHSLLLQEIQVVFLDIEMPNTNGLELASQLLEINSSLMVIFVTAHQEYALQAFELNALDYVMKPLQLDRLQKALERIEVNIRAQTNDPFSIRTSLQIKVCGEFSLSLAEKKLPNLKWRTSKSQELFLYLLHNFGKSIHKTELLEILWPEMDEDKAYPQLYTAIYHTRKTLHPLREHLSIKNETGGYMLVIQNSFIDINEWEKTVQSALSIDSKSITKYEETMNLYTGSYLQDYDYIWAESERYRLDQLWVKTATRIAEWYENNQDLEEAEAWYLKICAIAPEDEHSHFALMKLYARFNYGLLIDHQYNQLKRTLENLDLSISPVIQEWYDQYRNKRKTEAGT
ncbi:response regulator [Bacillus sp. SD088]|uniref:response regulator n=1 Tax=Bacillus sp. SD088 TaxID=2782012 RepID=UPI001A95C48D|nr:response regulator [Bacillus sp. SD088]MBO0994998.1 response regulator [Bacillus sp. SD088]